MTIDELIRDAHAMAVANGWRPDPPQSRSVVEQVNDFHESISRAWREWRHGRMNAWWSLDGAAIDGDEIVVNDRFRWDGNLFLAGTRWNGKSGWSEFRALKPEGFWAEIADLCIRLADTMGAYGWRSKDWQTVAGLSIPDFICEAHETISLMTGEAAPIAWSDGEYFCGLLMLQCFVVAEEVDINLWSVIAEKMAYSATRPQRHGGLKA